MVIDFFNFKRVHRILRSPKIFDFYGFWGMATDNGKERPAALIEASARFQVGFLFPDGFL